MKIPCPSCKQRLEIDEQLAGKTIECPACNANLSLAPIAAQTSSNPVRLQDEENICQFQIAPCDHCGKPGKWFGNCEHCGKAMCKAKHNDNISKIIWQGRPTWQKIVIIIVTSFVGFIYILPEIVIFLYYILGLRGSQLLLLLLCLILVFFSCDYVRKEKEAEIKLSKKTTKSNHYK